ncbi:MULTISPECIES: DsbC family protein [Psychrobacter]|jgi:thiol:disulfide interchange protein DsbC|uniref:DsbC family protein n=1 Tax=Psychrobacter TaxID=497 RepID=UPI000C3417C4|nr:MULTISPECIES: DsbC family protein [Psychrobacter]MBA6244022.1 DsbC family protein [Psychrobacter sp. Urea-trap-18]MBA6287238.1 DsbC family protein [Psychrobacter sp. Urea-trap-16]MBA6318352.1 DsbC family protein [Psychrobacter sp. Urea-trap-20]MBA6335296.1 DsbC family protein [Psychrobacter sp. Urea-trap-19]PKG60319.1 thiol:disulfide interchange protein [Psychrobacter sp. Choline-3u-12]
MPFPTIKNTTLRNPLSRTVLSRFMMSALLVGIAAGCSNNAADATSNTSVVNAAQTNATAAKPSAGNDATVVKALQANLKSSGIEETIVSAVPTDMDGIYWVTAEGLPSFFTDKAGKHIIQGQIIAVGDAAPVDISAALVATTAQEALKAVDKKDMVIYPAKGETKAVIYAFTDADCGYCRKLHSEMDDINARGIEVRYLAWPRSQESVPKMEAIWCSQDRKAAMDQAKIGANVQAPSCANPVQEHMALGSRLGVRGTPAVFTETGQQVGGYLPAAELAQAVGAN